MKTAVELYNEISVQHRETAGQTHIQNLLMCELILSVQDLIDKLDDVHRVLQARM